nr:PREDICTED: uncharacterized protein LOC108199226 isoform X1 [Daucus carota subsp. sativus]XP_017222443.1 PREDICTED: uncharacterized protein LOC108199226 isoform X1 [Daucus carota subsp. sativus]XP_017222444.1 PREDICTED: uncharacterized protein LOC108199226 isoform X1 [Daucus carota subsp. sativus]XP_017222445.1 PREDICTED: uncharacterized protein LOC108199226 isoform X1 [Daucus carota subsp. sativus]
MSSRSYEKCVTMLENVAKVRSGILMLDLECNWLLSEMFQNFLSSIREFHPKNIFKHMETVMCLVLEESDDDSLSLELLAVILAILKRDNEEILVSAQKLAESILVNCGVKLKPQLKQAVNSLGLPLDGYSDIVATICNESNSEVEPNDGDFSSQKEKPEAVEVVISKLFGHDDKIVAIDKTDGAAEDFCTQNSEQISEKPQDAELVGKTYRHDDEIFTIHKNDGAADDEKPDAAEMAVKSLFAGVETGMPASKSRIDWMTTPMDYIGLSPMDYIGWSYSSPVTFASILSQSLNTTSKWGNVLENDNAGVVNENAMRLHLTTEDIPSEICAAVDETTMPSSKRRRCSTTEDMQTQIDNSAFGDNAPGSKPQSQSQAKSKNGDEESSKLAEFIGILAEALNDMVDSKKLPIPVEELWGFIHEMKLDGDLAGDAFVFLLDRPVQLKGLVSTPIGIRKSILLKMMMRDAK